MALRKPLVIISGLQSELPPGDFVEGVQLTLVSNPSGLYLSGTSLGFDGVAQRTANSALASGNAALTILASGVTLIAPNAVTTVSISGKQVTTEKIADGAITSGQLAPALATLVNPNYFIDLL